MSGQPVDPITNKPDPFVLLEGIVTMTLDSDDTGIEVYDLQKHFAEEKMIRQTSKVFPGSRIGDVFGVNSSLVCDLERISCLRGKLLGIGECA